MKAYQGKLLAVLVLLSTFVMIGSVSSQAQAATCTRLSAYTDYYKDKPTLLIWDGINNMHPLPNTLSISYYETGKGWVTVPSPSDDGVRTDAPQNLSNGWHYYFIATRWVWRVFQHQFWNDDWRWLVIQCK